MTDLQGRGGQAAEPPVARPSRRATSPIPATPFDSEGYSLLKFHGIYQGYDRDSATELKQAATNPSTTSSWCACASRAGGSRPSSISRSTHIADAYANGSLRVTTRQSIQFHGVVKSGLKAAMGEINAALMTTLAACGDVVRTVTTVPAPIRDPVHDRLEADARLLSTQLLPQTGAYHEIWVDGEKWSEDQGGRAARPALRRALSAAQVQDRPRGPRGQHDRRADQRSRRSSRCGKAASSPATISCSAAVTA